jgi:splicing factor 3B subunit 1
LILEATEEGDSNLISERSSRIQDRENDYQARRFGRSLSPSHHAENEEIYSSDEVTSYSYLQAMKEQKLERERQTLLRQAQKNIESHEKDVMSAEKRPFDDNASTPSSASTQSVKRRRWDMPTPSLSSRSESEDDMHLNRFKVDNESYSKSEWEDSKTPIIGFRNNETDSTPVSSGRSRWDATPVHSGKTAPEDGYAKRSRWDATPKRLNHDGILNFNAGTPISASTNYTLASSLDFRNRLLTDDELNAILPSEGYAILEVPSSYVPIRTPSRKLDATPFAVAIPSGFQILPNDPAAARAVLGLASVPGSDNDLPFSKPEDYQYFSKLLTKADEENMSLDEAKERKILKLLLRIKNGSPAVRRVSLRQLTERAREFGAGPLFDQILPLLMSPALEDAERHLLVKVIDRLLFKLEDAVRPYVHKILVVIEPLLIDEDYYARQEGREIIANLSKAAGLATMIATMRPDIDHVDEYVRNTTARAFAIVASSLGVPALLPFIRAVCSSRKSWQARHTGAKIVQQIAMTIGVGVVSHLSTLVEAIASGIEDEQVRVRTMVALAIASLAESAAPYGIESFEPVLRPIWKGIRSHRGKALAAFLKAVGFLLGLMAEEQAEFYGKELIPTLVREFASPDDEMKRIVLNVLKSISDKCKKLPREMFLSISDDFFAAFWSRRGSLDRRVSRAILEATVALTTRLGVGRIAGPLIERLKDEAEALRKLALEALEAIVIRFGAAELDDRAEEQLIDGLVTAIQEPGSEENTGSWLIRGWGVLASALGGTRLRPYLSQLASLILWRLGNRSARIRQQAAELVAVLAPVFAAAGEESTLNKLAIVLYENLGEEYPDVLASIILGLKSIAGVIGLNKLTPSVSDLLPRLTPILRNRHERVQDTCIQLVGVVADRSGDAVSSREWMRICFELLDLLKAQRKSVRMEAVRTFGSIARAIGPHDVLATLLSNLRVQERQNRVCTTVAIAIVAERCAPFTVLPGLMNEYRVPELNVQNGVLKSLAFLFEYIGESSRDYIYAVTPLLEDALTDRDQVHRQLAANVTKNLALGVHGFGCEDALQHLLNLLLPNIFESSAHVITAVIEAIDAVRMSSGSGVVLLYLIQGLFHPARKVRDIYWKMYNNLIIGGQESAVPVYPEISDQEGFSLSRNVLNIIL